MKTSVKPMTATILFGIISAAMFIPMTIALRYITYWPLFSFRLILWLYLVCYALFLVRWGKGVLKLIVFPLLLLFLTAIVESSNIVFFLLFLGILSWIRSSLCFQKSLFMMLLTELVLCLGGGALIVFFYPQTQIAWTLGICQFCLVQSLYFISWEGRDAVEEEKQKEIDPFERASRQVEKILSISHYS
jgi:hypothetical protein